jgi:hypothetical protein
LINDFTNATFWILAAVLGVLLCAWALLRRKPGEFDRVVVAVRRLLSSAPVLVILIAGNSVVAGFAIYMSYVAPLNIMQDIASAQEFLKGKPLYPPNMGELMRESMQKEPPRFSLGKWSPKLREREARQQLGAGMIVVQAHPPLMTLVFAPSVALFGVRGTCVAVALFSLLALFLTDWALIRSLDLHLSSREQLALAFGTLGWYPVISTFRWGQSGILLGALIVVAWLCLRGGRPTLAGISIGAATCLKVFPGLLLVYFLFRHRRAFVATVLSMLVLTGFGVAIVGLQGYRDYSEAGRFVLTRFGGSHHNISLLGVVVRNVGAYLGSGFHETTPIGMAIYLVLSVGLVGVVLWLLLAKPTVPSGNLPGLDFEYVLIVALMPLLSPLSWDHYMPVLLLPIFFLGGRILTNQPAGPTVLGLAGLLTALAIPAWSFHFDTRVSPVSPAMLVLWAWTAVLYWRWKRSLVVSSPGRQTVTASASKV